MANDPKNIIRYECEVSRETDKDGKRIDTRPLNVTFDFTGVTTSQLQNSAIRQFVVRLQGQLRGMTTRRDKPLKWSDAVATANGKTIKVVDFLKDSRSRKSPEQKRASAVKDVLKMDEDNRRRTVLELARSLGMTVK